MLEAVAAYMNHHAHQTAGFAGIGDVIAQVGQEQGIAEAFTETSFFLRLDGIVLEHDLDALFPVIGNRLECRGNIDDAFLFAYCLDKKFRHDHGFGIGLDAYGVLEVENHLLNFLAHLCGNDVDERHDDEIIHVRVSEYFQVSIVAEHVDAIRQVGQRLFGAGHELVAVLGQFEFFLVELAELEIAATAFGRTDEDLEGVIRMQAGNHGGYSLLVGSCQEIDGDFHAAEQQVAGFLLDLLEVAERFLDGGISDLVIDQEDIPVAFLQGSKQGILVVDPVRGEFHAHALQRLQEVHTFVFGGVQQEYRHPGIGSTSGFFLACFGLCHVH